MKLNVLQILKNNKMKQKDYAKKKKKQTKQPDF